MPTRNRRKSFGERACFKNRRGSAARDFGRSRGSTMSCASLVCSDCEARESPQRALSAEPTKAAGKRPAARRVFAQKAFWIRCASVTAPLGGCSLVESRHRAFCAKTEPLLFLKHALRPSAPAKPAGMSALLISAFRFQLSAFSLPLSAFRFSRNVAYWAAGWRATPVI